MFVIAEKKVPSLEGCDVIIVTVNETANCSVSYDEHAVTHVEIKATGSSHVAYNTAIRTITYSPTSSNPDPILVRY